MKLQVAIDRVDLETAKTIGPAVRRGCRYY
jgi:3-keto-L-gulonate-6-phosphate decarboxylase